MAEFQSFAKEEGFAPAEVPSITPYINENLEALRQSEKQNAQDQYVVDKQRASELGKSFQSLAQLGEKTAKFVFDREKEFRTKETQKMELEEYNKYLADPEGYVSGIFKSDLQDMQNLNSQTENMGAEAYIGTGNNEVARQIRDLSGWREIRQAKIQLAMANKYYESWLPKQLQDADITDQASRGAALSQARSAFMAEFGLLGFSDNMLGEVLYPAQMKVHAKFMKEGAELDAQNDNFQRTTEATSLFEDDFNFGALQNTFATSIDEKGKVLGNARGFDQAIAHLKKMFQAGTISAEQLEAIKNQPMPGMNGRTYGEMKPTAFENLDQELSSEERQNAQEIREQQQAEARVLADDYFNKVSQDGLVPTKADIEAIQEQVRKHGGVEDPRLNALLKNTASAKTAREANAMFENMAAIGTLTVDDVLAIPSQEVQQKWLKVAQAIEKQQKGDVTVHHKALQELVETTPNLSATVDGKRGFETVEIVHKLQGEFDRRLAELIANDDGQSPPGTLVQQALAETRAMFIAGRKNDESIYYFSSDTSDPTKPPGFVTYRNTLASLTSPEKNAQARARLAHVTQGFKTEGIVFLNKPGSILTREEFLQMDKDMLEKDFKMPGIIRKAAQLTGLTPSEVLKRAREALDLPPMTMPPSLELIDNTLSPEAKGLINNFQTAQRTQRGLSQLRQFEPSMVKGGYGPTIQKAAEEYDIPVGILAALLEQESAYRPEIINGTTKSSAGALGIAQFMPGTAAEMGVNPLDPESAIPGAAKYLRHLMDTYGFDLKTAIYAYNAGPGTIQQYGIGATDENKNYYPGIIAKATKYGYGSTALNDPSIIRPSMLVN
jgi:soluble lytic murein transglycosylase-like protein